MLGCWGYVEGWVCDIVRLFCIASIWACVSVRESLTVILEPKSLQLHPGLGGPKYKIDVAADENALTWSWWIEIAGLLGEVSTSSPDTLLEIFTLARVQFLISEVKRSTSVNYYPSC